MKSVQRWCPNCGAHLRVTHTRATREGDMTWRRKKCPQCGLKMSTIEYTMSMEGYHSEDELSPEDVKRMRDEVSTKLEDVSGPLEDAGAKAPLSRLEVVNG